MQDRIWFVRGLTGIGVRTPVRYSGTREGALAYARAVRAQGRRAVVGWALEA